MLRELLVKAIPCRDSAYYVTTGNGSMQKVWCRNKTFHVATKVVLTRGFFDREIDS